MLITNLRLPAGMAVSFKMAISPQTLDEQM